MALVEEAEEDLRAPKLMDLDPEDFEHDMGIAITYAQRGRSVRQPRQPLAIVCRALPVVADSIEGRFALEKRRPVSVRGLAALTGLTQTRIRQLNPLRDADGNVEWNAAVHFLQGRRVTGFVQRTFLVTPSWWRGLHWDDPRRGRAERILGEAVQGHHPSVIFTLGANTVDLSFTLQASDGMSDEDDARLQAEVKARLEKIEAT